MIVRHGKRLAAVGIVLVLVGCSSGREGFTFVHVTDTHVTGTEREGSTGWKVAGMYGEISGLRPRPAFVINTGDYVESGGKAEYDTHEKLLKKLEVPQYGVPGNHDVRWNPLGKEGYERRVGPLYRSWDYGGVHFVTLDSTVLLSHFGHIDQRQLDWLAGDLEKAGRARPIVIAMHHPIGREGSLVDNGEALMEVTRPYNVRLWLFGHGHSDAAWSVNGVPAIEAKGLYQGSYHVIEVREDEIRIRRRSTASTGPLAEGDTVEVKESPVVKDVSGSVWAVWRRDLRGAVQSHLVRAGDALYVTTMGGELVAVEAETGRERWKVRTGGPVFSTPCVAGGMVYFGSADHLVYGVDAGRGQVKWRRETGGRVFAGPAAAQGVVCVASVDETIYGLDARTGEIRWRTACGGMYQSNVATDGRRFFMGGWDNYLRCLDARTGREEWAIKLGKSMYYAPAIASPAVGGGKVFVTSNDGVLHAVDIESGQMAWEFDGKKLGYSSPLYHAGRIYVAFGEGGRVLCLEASSGEKVWESSAGAVIYDSSFAFGGGNVFIGSANGTVSAFGASDGVLQWQHSLGAGHLLASPATDERRVYICSMNGKLTALRVRGPSGR